MVDFNKLRASKGNNLKTMQARLEKTEGGFQADPRIWKPTRNQENKSENVIRLLPIPYVDMLAVEEGRIPEDLLTPMAKVVSHHFKGANGWFVENSLQTFGEGCPVREYCTPLWKQAKDNNDEALKNKLRPMLPNETFYAGVLVIKDGTNPANNGKIMLYEFGSTVRKLIEKCGAPEFEGDPAFDPFDPWGGADLRLNLTYEKKNFGGRDAMVPKFDAVKWAANAPLAGGDEKEIERIWKEQHSIAEFYDREKKFKTYDQLKARFYQVMGLNSEGQPRGDGSSLGRSAEEALNNQMASTPASTPPAASAASSAPVQQAQPTAQAASAPAAGSADMDDFEAMLRAGT